MGLKVIITSLSTFFNCSAEMNSRWHPEISAKQPCYLPYGKADGTATTLQKNLVRMDGPLVTVNPYLEIICVTDSFQDDEKDGCSRIEVQRFKPQWCKDRLPPCEHMMEPVLLT